MSTTFEDRLRQTRVRLGLTQKQLAEQSGISHSAINRADSGTTRLSSRNRDLAEAWLRTHDHGTFDP